MSKTEEITITFKLPQKVKGFLNAYTQLLKYKSLEDFLREEIQYHFSKDAVANRCADIYFGNDEVDEIMKRHGLLEKKEEAAIE